MVFWYSFLFFLEFLVSFLDPVPLLYLYLFIFLSARSFYFGLTKPSYHFSSRDLPSRAPMLWSGPAHSETATGLSSWRFLTPLARILSFLGSPPHFTRKPSHVLPEKGQIGNKFSVDLPVWKCLYSAFILEECLLDFFLSIQLFWGF